VDILKFDEPKTRLMVATLEALKVEKRRWYFTADGNQNVVKSARNIPGVKPLRVDFMNVYDLLNYDTLLITRDAVAKVEEVFA
jgi:large subunit ribosomal protein L4